MARLIWKTPGGNTFLFTWFWLSRSWHRVSCYNRAYYNSGFNSYLYYSGQLNWMVGQSGLMLWSGYATGYVCPKFHLNFFVFSVSYFLPFRTLRKITIKHECMIGSHWNLVHRTGALKGISVPTLGHYNEITYFSSTARIKIFLSPCKLIIQNRKWLLNQKFFFLDNANLLTQLSLGALI